MKVRLLELAVLGEEWLGEIDFDNLNSFMKDIGSDMTFYELVLHIMEQGWGVESIADLVTWIREMLFSELQANKTLFLEIILITFCFSLLKNSIGTFGSSCILDSCFLLVYCTLALLLINSIYIFQGIVTKTVGNSVNFMRMFVPCFCTGMIFSSNVYASAGFYQLAFIVIFFVEWAMETVLLPCVHIYILLQICSHFFEEGAFENLAELASSVVTWGLKMATTAVFGLSVVQNLMNPIKDRMAQGSLGRAVSILPSVGDAVGSVGEVMLGAGMMIKNGIGIAGIVVLLFIGFGPVVKAGCMVFSYKLLAAVTEPLADKRISGCMKGMSTGALLYLKVMGYSLLLFFITIALAAGATSFAY